MSHMKHRKQGILAQSETSMPSTTHVTTCIRAWLRQAHTYVDSCCLLQYYNTSDWTFTNPTEEKFNAPTQHSDANTQCYKICIIAWETRNSSLVSWFQKRQLEVRRTSLSGCKGVWKSKKLHFWNNMVQKQWHASKKCTFQKWCLKRSTTPLSRSKSVFVFLPQHAK